LLGKAKYQLNVFLLQPNFHSRIVAKPAAIERQIMESFEHTSFEGDAPSAAEETVIKDRRELALVAVERT